MNETPTTENHVAELNAALAAAQGEFPAIAKDKTVKTQSYEFSYASLDKIIDAVRPALAKNGLAIVQLLETTETGPSLRTELRHQAGGVVGSSFRFTRMPETPQQLGSLLTYLRRYALTALLGVAAEDDDDAQAANSSGQKMISDSQRRRLFAIANEAAISEEQLRTIINGVTGDPSTKSIPADKYDEIVALVDAEQVPF